MQILDKLHIITSVKANGAPKNRMIVHIYFKNGNEVTGMQKDPISNSKVILPLIKSKLWKQTMQKVV